MTDKPDNFPQSTGSVSILESMIEAVRTIQEWAERDAEFTDYLCKKCGRKNTVQGTAAFAFMRHYPGEGIFLTCEQCITGIGVV